LVDKLPLSLPFPKRHWRNYLIDWRLQLRYVLLMAMVSAIISSALGYLIWLQAASASDAILDLAKGSGDGVQSVIAESLKASDSSLIWTMALAGFGLTVVLSLYTTVFTHRVAGPIHKVSQYFDQMASGRLGNVRALRKGDLLKEFYEAFRATHQTVRARHAAENALVGKFLLAMSDVKQLDPAMTDALARLGGYHSRRERALAE
jgi:hypothetical protein